MTSPATGRLVSVDVLRGCAVLGVLLTHCFPHETALDYLREQSPWLGSLGAVVRYGVHGVGLFFVISGFCIHLGWARQHAASGETRLGFGAFWRRRLHRLYWPYLVVLGVCALMTLAAYVIGRAHYYPEPKLRWISLDFLAHVFMLHGFYPLFDAGGGNPAMWTLAREEYLYAMYFVLIALRRRLGLGAITLGVLALGIVFPYLMRPLMPEGPEMEHLVRSSAVVLWIQWVLGAVAVEASLGLLRLPRWCRNPWMVPVWFAAGMLARVWARDLQPVCYGLSFFTLINVCVDAERTRALSSRRLVVWLSNVGIFSYSLYLVHYPTIMILRELFGFIALPANAWVALAGSAVKFVVSFYVAKLFFLLVERRFLNSAAEFRTVEPAHLTSPGRREYSREP